jgi:hypothetical protein
LKFQKEFKKKKNSKKNSQVFRQTNVEHSIFWQRDPQFPPENSKVFGSSRETNPRLTAEGHLRQTGTSREKAHGGTWDSWDLMIYG